MENLDFKADRPFLATEYDGTRWIVNSGKSADELRPILREICENNAHASAISLRATLFATILDNARLGIDAHDVFADTVDGASLMDELRNQATASVLDDGLLKSENAERLAHLTIGDYVGGADFGHASPDWQALVSLGFTGILRRAQEARLRKEENGELSPTQAEYYDAVETVYTALLRLLSRFAKTLKMQNNPRLFVVADRLAALSERAPVTFGEALQLIVIAYPLFSKFEGCYTRSLGGLDTNLYSYYAADLSKGVSASALDEYIRYFYYKFAAQDMFANVPFFIGGTDASGKCAVNPLSYALIRNYVEMDIYCPKIHFRLCKDFPQDLKETALASIVKGNSSFLFIHDDVVIPSLVGLGQEQEDARNYTVIGCYEAAAEGKELCCSCTGLVSLPKILQLVLEEKRANTNGEYRTFEALFADFLTKVEYCISRSMAITTAYEEKYSLVTSAPLTSATFSDSVFRGVDITHGGAKYNNSGLNVVGMATAIDSLCALKALVFDRKLLSFSAFCAALEANWQGSDSVRTMAQTTCEKFGNGDAFADELYRKIYDFIVKCFDGKQNGRGGLFRLGLFSIDNCFWLGKAVGATADGRASNAPLSKNLCASVGMDKSGVTALIRSVTAIDFTKAPNGSVLDVILHPSAVQGEEGLAAFSALVDTYFALGGYAVHVNVFSKDQLIKAQRDPSAYANLQVRVCGWNVYFCDLPKDQQDAFIASAQD